MNPGMKRGRLVRETFVERGDFHGTETAEGWMGLVCFFSSFFLFLGASGAEHGCAWRLFAQSED